MTKQQQERKAEREHVIEGLECWCGPKRDHYGADQPRRATADRLDRIEDLLRPGRIYAFRPAHHADIRWLLRVARAAEDLAGWANVIFDGSDDLVCGICQAPWRPGCSPDCRLVMLRDALEDDRATG